MHEILYIVIVIFAGIGIGAVICEIQDNYDALKIRFNEWRNKKCKIKCLCEHSYSIKYLWYNNNEIYLECDKCNKVKKIRLDDKTFETFVESRKKENKAIKVVGEKQIIYDLDGVLKRLKEELSFADKEKERCIKENILQFDAAKGYANGIANAIDYVKGGVKNEIN